MILDDMEANPDKYKGKKLTELTDKEEVDEENSIEYGKAYYKKTLLPKMTLVKNFLLVVLVWLCFWIIYVTLLILTGRKLV